MSIRFNRDSALGLAVIIMPFTALRIGPIGIGEVIFLLVFTLLIASRGGVLRSPRQMFFSRFWIFYLSIISISLLTNIFAADNSQSIRPPWLFDLSGYIFVAIAVYVIEQRLDRSNSGSIDLIWPIYIVQFSIFAFLHLLSGFTPTIFGLPLRYYSWFMPLANNIHQTAMLFSALPFLGLFFVTQLNGKVAKSMAIISVLWYSAMAIDSGSTKAMMGLVLGSVLIPLYYYHRLSTGRQRLGVLSLIFSSALFFFTLQYPIVANKALEFFNENDLHGGRSFLYMQSIQKIGDAWLIGYGPGSHLIDFAEGSPTDAHQTILTATLQGGFLGLCLILAFVIKLFFRIFANPFLFSGLASISVYVLGGDILRRAPIWILLVMLGYLAKQHPVCRPVQNGETTSDPIFNSANVIE